MAALPSIAIANIALAITAGSAIVWRLQARRRGEDVLGPFRRPSPLKAPIAALVLLSIASAVFSTLPSRSLPQVKGLGTFALVAFTVALVRDQEDADLLIDVWRATTLYMVVRGLLQYLGGADNLGARITGGMSVYMTYAGLLMAFVLVLASRGLDASRPSRARAVDLVLAALGAAAVTLTLTRNAYLGLLVGGSALLRLWRPRLLLVLPAALAVLFLAVPAAVRSRAASAFDASDVTFRDRTLMWRAGVSMIADRPLFGLGPKRVKDLYPVYRRPGFVHPHPGALHDNVIMIAAETGIPSALAYLAFVAAFIVHALRRFRRATSEAERAVARGAIAVMAALFAAGLFEYNFGDVEVLMAMLVIASLPFAVLAATPALESSDGAS